MKPQTTKEIFDIHLAYRLVRKKYDNPNNLWIPDALNKARLKFINYYVDNRDDFCKDYPEMNKLLTITDRKLTQHGFNMVLISNGLSGVFDEIIEKEMK